MPTPESTPAPARPRSWRILAALLVLAATASWQIAAVEASPTPADPTIRAVLRRVATTYIRPERLDPEAMLRGAVSVVARWLEAEIEETPAGYRLVLDGGEVNIPAPRPEGPGGLPARLGPSLEAALDGIARLPAADEAEEDTSPPGTEELRGVLLRGALRTLDRYSTAYTGVRRGSMMSRYTGTMTGIGARVGRREEAVKVLEVFADSGAADAGLESGDIILEIDDESADGMSVADVIALLRGESGTVVELTVQRDGSELLIPITRRKYSHPSIVQLPAVDGVGVIRVTRFSKNTPEQFAGYLDLLALDPAVNAVVVDLRSNGGGSMLGASAVADQLLTRGVILETRGRGGGPVAGLRDRYDASPRGWPALPVAVLVDGSTASSSELLTAALAWNDRALVVGQRTFGKNLIQKVYNYDDADLTVKFSVALFFTAARSLPDDGIRPDVWIRGGDEEAPEDMRFLVDPGDGDDPWLDRCRRLLVEHAAPRRSTMLQSLRTATTTPAVADTTN